MYKTPPAILAVMFFFLDGNMYKNEKTYIFFAFFHY